MNKTKPKDIQLTGIKHAKEAIADLLNEQSEMAAERDLLNEQSEMAAERDLLKAQVEELRGALEAYHEFGIFVALVRGPSGEDIQPRLAEAQIMARDALHGPRGASRTCQG